MPRQVVSTPVHRHSVVSQVERSWLVGALIVGIAWRWGCLWRLGIEHYDEAVYASNLLFGPESGFEFPGRQYHAPALVPALIEWCTILWRMAGLPEVGWLPMLPGLLAGTALILSAWWIARRWFSPVAGISAAWLIALSDYQAFYARTALTDPWLVLWLLWAVHASWQAMASGRMRDAIVAGLFTALAWWSKYNGWLPLAITAAGGLCYVLLSADRRATGKVWLRVLAMQSCVAFVAWSPVLGDCQIVGGYSAVAANHQGYILGWSNWWRDWLQQNANIGWYRGWSPFVALAFMLVGTESMLANPTPQHRYRRAWAAAMLLMSLLMDYAGFPLAASLLVGLAAVVSALWAWRTGQIDDHELRAGCLLSAWYAGLFLTTPLYQPYPRLCLPMSLAGMLGVAWWLHRQTGAARVTPIAGVQTRRQSWPAAACSVISLGLLFCIETPAWEQRTSARRAAAELAGIVKPPSRTVVYVYADPGMFFELSQAGFLARPRGDFQIEPVPQADQTLLVLGLFADRLTSFDAEWSQAEDRYELVTELASQPSSLVLLDNNSPRELTEHPQLRQQSWRVYRVKP